MKIHILLYLFDITSHFVFIFKWGQGISNMWLCLESIPSSMPRGHSWQCLGDNIYCLGFQLRSDTCKENNYLIFILFLWPVICFLTTFITYLQYSHTCFINIWIYFTLWFQVFEVIFGCCFLGHAGDAGVSSFPCLTMVFISFSNIRIEDTGKVPFLQ